MQLFNGRQVNRRSADEYRGQPSPQAVQTLTINCTECAAITFRIIVKPTLSVVLLFACPPAIPHTRSFRSKSFRLPDTSTVRRSRYVINSDMNN